MKTIALILIAAASLLAQDKKSDPPKTAPKADPAALPNIPEGAKEVGDGVYRFTDAKGKTWLYRRTPFGVAKWEDKQSAQPAAADDPAPATVTDLGDSVQFQRDTPFGPQKWTRKKSELTDDEKAIIARREHAKPPAAAPKASAGKTETSGKTPERP
jgi:hypothetical protein